jgi:hypothetical protein
VAFLVWRTDDLDNAACRLLDMGRIVENLGDNHLAVFRAVGLALGDQHTVRDFRIVRYHQPDAAFPDELPGNLSRRAFEHFDELAFRLTTPVEPDDPDDDPITMEQRTHLARRKIDIIAVTIVSDDKSETVRVAAHGTGDEIQFRRQAILTAAVFDDLASPVHRLEAFLEQGPHSLALEAESINKFLYFQRSARFF